MFPVCSKIGFANVPRMLVENSQDSHKPVEINSLRAHGALRSGRPYRSKPARRGRDGPLRGRKRGDQLVSWPWLSGGMAGVEGCRIKTPLPVV